VGLYYSLNAIEEGAVLKNLKVLFWVTIFLNSFLLFLVEPMFGRMILPIAGGSMSSWNVALMCFQILLLGGYMYTHYLPKLIGFRTYMKVHMVLLILSALFSLMFFKVRSFTVNTSSPTLDVIRILLSTIGIPFFAVSTSSTNFQKLYNLNQKESPYHLYSLSNSGNLLALIGYGLVVEVVFGLKNQMLIWNVLYIIAVTIGVYIGINVYRSLDTSNFLEVSEQVEYCKKVPVGLKRKLYWLLLSFIPCSLMIATNSVLDNVINVNHIHYFWLLPLIIYLIAYIIAFSRLKLLDLKVFEKMAFWSTIIAIMILFTKLNIYVYVASMITLFFVSLVCNLYIVKDIPHESNLTEFYMYISIGGALGGVFASIISPLIFDNVYEYPLVAILFLFTLYFQHKKESVDKFYIESWEYALLFISGLCIVILKGMSKISIILFLLLFILYMIRRIFTYQKTRLVNLIMLIIITMVFDYALLKNNEYQARNFYGVKTIINTDYTDKNDMKYELANLIYGNTLHGSQFEKGSEYEFEALTYYDREGSTIGRFFTSKKEDVQNVGVVGLGIGTLSALSDETQTWKYFEIDPQVIDIARNPSYFTMMERYKHEVVLGDARITLQAEEDNSFDVLVLDAYSGDIIPASLLTKEAVELYKSKIKDNGILFFHTSNMQFDLRPVLSKVAEILDVDCYIDTAKSEGVVISARSEWIMMTKNKDLVSESWTKIEKYPDFEIWTDDKYSISTVMKDN
jgi:spermidine synthase